MMLLVDGAGYATAESAFVEGNQVAAVAHERLAGALSSCSAGMAGNDTSSEAFAASYDTAAADAVGALADLVSSFSGLGELTRASLANHHRAEARSVVGGGTVYEGGLLPRGSCVDVLPSPPPASLGGDSPSVPAHLAMVLDHVQGFVWPSADTARLRLAAAAWSGAADAVDDLATYCDCAVRGFWDERSPEVPLAVDATHELRDTVRDLAAEYAALAAACSSYADQVDARRAEVVALAEWLLEQVVEGIVISVALGCLTGGAGAAAGLAATAARIAAESPRFLRIIEALAAFARALSDTTRVARESVVLARARLLKFSRAKPVDSDFGPRTLGAAQRLKYELNPKHGVKPRGASSPAPNSGQEVLDFSVAIKPTTTRRVGVDPETGEFVVFDETGGGVFHGHVRPWTDLTPDMQRALRLAGLVDRKGRIIA